jgi:chromosome partitioning protein
MKILAIANQKGGSGKSTTAVALAWTYSQRGTRTLLVDLDPQAHATCLSGLYPPAFAGLDTPTIAATFLERAPITTAIVASSFGYDVAIADEGLLEVEIGGGFSHNPTWAFTLRHAFREIDQLYDLIILDCAPHPGLLTQCALVAATNVLIPVEAHPLALLGLYQFADNLKQLVETEANPALRLSGILLTKYVQEERICQSVLQHLERGVLAPYLLRDRISRSTAVARSAAISWQPGGGRYEGVSIPLGAPVQATEAHCNAAKDYTFAAQQLWEAINGN